jgi:hypothetical protein
MILDTTAADHFLNEIWDAQDDAKSKLWDLKREEQAARWQGQTIDRRTHQRLRDATNLLNAALSELLEAVDQLNEAAQIAQGTLTCGNPRCGKVIQGKDRLKLGECERCYRHRAKWHTSWPDKGPA